MIDCIKECYTECINHGVFENITIAELNESIDKLKTS